MNFLSKDYLPNSEKRINHLRKIIDGRPVVILAAGPSINEFEKRNSELRDADICYFGLNSFIQETYILQQIEKHLSVYMDSCYNNIPFTIKDIIDFLDRDEDNMFISSFWLDTFGLLDNDFDLNQFLSKYDRKLIFFSLSYERTVPNSDNPLHFIVGNSLQMLIQLAMIGKSSRIVLFGADGYCKENIEKYYYRQGEYGASPRENLIHDTKYFNAVTPIAIRNVYKTYNLTSIDILNCSEDSYYTSFPIISYDDAFRYLLAGKKYTRKSDLRVPKVSVISSVVNSGVFSKVAVESISNQSYSNHEHIIIYNEEDDEIQDMIQQFPHIRWFSEKNYNHLQAFKKGISMAKGEYIFHYRITDGHLNQDWINACVEVLENHPDISLVWGLSQIMAKNGAPGRIINDELFDNPPPQGKEFIYYWLKKKTFFPEGNLCVRKSVLEDCFPFNDANIEDERKAWLSFNYHFNSSGYLPFFVPLIVNYHRTYFDQGGHRPQGDPVKMHLPYYVPVTENEKVRKEVTDESWNTMLDAYHDDIRRYKKLLMKGKIVHRYRNGNGEVLPDCFSRIMLLFYDIIKYVEKKLPPKYSLILKRVSNAYKKYRWGIFKVVTIKILNRLKNRGTENV